jgi:hypothetical protein
MIYTLYSYSDCFIYLPTPIINLDVSFFLNSSLGFDDFTLIFAESIPILDFGQVH